MRDHVLEKLEVGRDPLNSRLAEGASHPSNRLSRRVAPGGDLHEQGVVERGDDRPRMRAPGVDADPEARRALADGEPPMGRRKTARRVLGRHAALERVPAERDRVLGRHPRGGVADPCAGGNAELRLDDIDPGDFLGDGVLDLQARIDFDEVELLRVGVQEEFHAPRVREVRGARQRQRRLAELPALSLGQKRRRRPLDHLLMAPLDGAIPLEQMHQIAVEIPQDLDFNVARPPHQLLDVHLVVAERGPGFASRGLDERRKLPCRLDHAHAAAAAAPTGLEHERVAETPCEVLDPLAVARQRPGRRQDGHARGQRQGPRRDLVAQRAQHFRFRADEDDAGPRARGRELGALGEKPVAGMNGIRARLARHPDDIVHVEIGLDRRAAGGHEIALIGGEAMACTAIRFGENGDRARVELLRGAHDADGDLAAVGDE